MLERPSIANCHVLLQHGLQSNGHHNSYVSLIMHHVPPFVLLVPLHYPHTPCTSCTTCTFLCLHRMCTAIVQLLDCSCTAIRPFLYCCCTVQVLVGPGNALALALRVAIHEWTYGGFVTCSIPANPSFPSFLCSLMSACATFCHLFSGESEKRGVA